MYFFWGSTYVAIRYGVQVVPPFVLASVRYLIAGPLMLAICAARGLKLWQSKRDFAYLAAIGILLLGVGQHGLRMVRAVPAQRPRRAAPGRHPALRRRH